MAPLLRTGKVNEKRKLGHLAINNWLFPEMIGENKVSALLDVNIFNFTSRGGAPIRPPTKFQDAIQSINTSSREIQVLCISPTRALAMLLQKIISLMNSEIRCCACIEGIEIADIKSELQKGQHIISGTPAQISEMIKGNILNTGDIRLLVINDIFVPTNKEFKYQIDDLYPLLPVAPPVCLISIIPAQSNYLQCVFKVTITHAQNLKYRLTDAGMVRIKSALIDEIDKLKDDDDVHPQILVTFPNDGCLVLICNNFETSEWIKSVGAVFEPWPEAHLNVN